MKRLLLSSILCLFTLLAVAQVDKAEKSALIDFFNSTNGDQWNSKWDLEKPVASWEGVTVKDNKVVALRLLFNNVSGEIPASIKNLKNLKELELSFNQISGQLPESLGELSELEVLAFNGNMLTGTIPSSIGNLKNLKQLHLSSNKLTGTVPYNFENLRNIEVFNVFDNELSGDLPIAMTKNGKIREFLVAENDFEKPSEKMSIVLLSNSNGALDIENPAFTTDSKSVIALETSDDE